jgi:outer membrane protein assembly factor BamD (BamD/ComL family)
MAVEIDPRTGKPWGWRLDINQPFSREDALTEIARLKRELDDRNRTITELGLDRDRLYDAVYRAETIIRSYGNDDAANELLEMIGHE